MSASRALAATATVILALAASPRAVAQENDAGFDTSVARPAWPRAAGPLLLVDEAHRNLHTIAERYAAFAAVARSDGFRVEARTEPATVASLPAGAILVVANARGAEEPSSPAFAPEEIARLRAWVEAGGALFLIADHRPFGTAAAPLAAAFGVGMSDGHVRDEAHAAPELPGPFFLEFSRGNGLLGAHPILEGASPGERVGRVVTFGGQALVAPAGAAVLLRLGDGAEAVANPNDPQSAVEPVGGRAQALALELGAGRVVVAGEAGLFGAQILRGEAARRAGVPDPLHFGMNHPGTDNRQFLLNILHWLAGRP